MGYNSWNGLHCNIDENMMRKTAETLLSTGLAAYGFVFVNMDDCWQVRSCTRERARMAARGGAVRVTHQSIHAPPPLVPHPHHHLQ